MARRDTYAAVRRILCIFLIATMLFAADFLSDWAGGAMAASDGMIRVHLTRLGSPSTIRFTPNCDYVLMLDNGYAVPSGTAVSVQAAGGSLTVCYNGWQFECGSNVRLLRTVNGNRGVHFTSPSYSNLFSGDLHFYASGDTINTVLNIYIEDYLCGVVAYEMSDSYPLEALKAQAVAARNYALRQKSAHRSDYYDVTDNSSNQVFKGYNSSYGSVISAVRGTAGLVLYSGASLASCYYGASNGGQTESTKNAWGNSLSYSVVKDDPYDLQSAGKKTTAVIRRDASGLNSALASALKAGAVPALTVAGMAGSDISIRSINSIAPRNPKFAAPSRLYKTLTFNITVASQFGAVTCDVDIPTYGEFESWYGLSINSGSNETISVDADASAFMVTFRRWGHGIGMSQRGAQVMARDYGASCSKILDFYYPGTSQRTLSLADTSGGASAGSAAPTPEPSESPTPEPSTSPTPEPSASPTPMPSISPTVEPGAIPTSMPTESPSPVPTAPPVPTPGATLPIFARPTPTPLLPDITPLPTLDVKPTLPIATQIALTPAPTFAPVITPAPQMTIINRIMYVDVSYSSTLSLRSEPSQNSRALAQLRRGTRVYARTLTNDWYYVTTESGISGYVAKRYVTAAEVPAYTPAPTKRVVTPIIDDCTAVDSGITFCSVYAVTTESARVRRSNSTSSASLGTLPAGITVRVDAFDRTWAYICLNGRYGFVQHKYLRIVS